MSRILRRPMFRGGRVDSRGTGITSGLGYEKGGRVGYKDAGAVTGGGYKFSETPIARGINNFTNYGINAGLAGLLDFVNVPLNTLGRAFGYNPGFSGTKQMDLLTGGQFSKQTGYDPEKAYLFGPTSAKTGFTLPSMSNKESEDQAAILAAEEELKRKKEFEDYQKELASQELNKAKAKIPGKEDIKESTKEYAEILGGDKARGKDVTDMLLSFAGKALKDDATVKSAFGEFAEEEAKRPGRKEKIDQAAATLAINEYIAGKKSKAELDRFFAQADYSASLKSRKGKKNIPANIIEAARSYGTGYKAIDFGLKMSFDNAPTNKMDKSEGQTVDKVPLTVDNIGQIFIEDEAPYNAIMVTIEDGKLIRDRLN